MNEYNEFNTESVGSHNGGEDIHIDGQAEETSACSGESEEVYSDDQILTGPKRGVSVVFENTVHKYCIWHIFTKLPMRLKVTDDQYKEAKNEFKSIALSSITRVRAYVGSTLKQFVQHYELALRDKNEKELASEYQFRYTKTRYNEPAVDGVEKYDITDTLIKNDFYGNEFFFRNYPWERMSFELLVDVLQKDMKQPILN
ncbi:hypothetical protein RND71_022866 [Anisodus tanguticus]|uniref:Protein FAR1-RELATED SEQUENCE n=1 Tax=Anisodus tanguticus TaxID=243964 RepID=A0AAE1RSW1_9SOLA|nr:hypothetical protein RND71_022866 [Anisodus tanguticus]